jgi:F-type H+-transporting ATPase subunit delta
MNESKISVRYSRALFQSAVENKQLDKVYQDMMFISEICQINEIAEVLNSPIIIPSKKKTILHAVLEKSIEKITLSLIDLLIKNGRESHLPAVTRVFRDEALKYRGITQTFLTTAVPVNDKIRKQITDLISSVFKTKVELKENIDSRIIGGFILRINDNFIDASVKNKLRKIKKGLSARMSSKQES